VETLIRRLLARIAPRLHDDIFDPPSYAQRMSRVWDDERRLRQFGRRRERIFASGKDVFSTINDDLVGDPISMFAVHGNPTLCEHPGPRRRLAAVPSSLER
jgi:hypothetical protein